MIPQIVTYNQKKSFSTYLETYKKQNRISDNYVFEILPIGKELSISQIKEVKKGIIYDFTEPQLYIFHDFDTGSIEAQNAFLKTLEEKQESVHFILIVKNPYKLLPTILSRSSSIKLDENVTIIADNNLDKYLETGDLKIMESYTLTQKDLDPLALIDSWISYFRSKLATRRFASQILKEILRTRALIINNNVNPQLTIDHLLIFMRNQITRQT